MEVYVDWSISGANAGLCARCDWPARSARGPALTEDVTH